MTYNCMWSTYKEDKNKRKAVAKFSRQACFGSISTGWDGVYYIAYGGCSGPTRNITFQQENIPLSDIECKEDKDNITLEEAELWADICALAGLPFKIVDKGIIPNSGNLPYIIFDVQLKDHFNNYSLVVHTLTALRYIREHVSSVKVMPILVEKFGFPKTEGQAWDYLSVAIRSRTEITKYDQSHATSGHSLIYNFSDEWPKSYGEIIDNFFIERNINNNNTLCINLSWSTRKNKNNKDLNYNVHCINSNKFKKYCSILLERYREIND